MPLYTAEALILRTYKLGDADRLVVFLTRDRGKKRGVAKGAFRSRSRFVGALEPLTSAEVAYFEREGRDLVRLNYVEARRSPLSAADGEALGHVGYFAELIDEWAPEADPNERLYRLGAAAVEAMAGGAPVDRLARYFEFWLLRLQGVYPSLAACAACAADLGLSGAVVSTREPAFLCPRCASTSGGLEVSLEALAFLRGAQSVGPDRLGGLPFTVAAARQLAAAHRALIRAHLDKELRSVRVLRAIEPDLER